MSSMRTKTQPNTNVKCPRCGGDGAERCKYGCGHYKGVCQGCGGSGWHSLVRVRSY